MPACDAQLAPLRPSLAVNNDKQRNAEHEKAVCWNAGGAQATCHSCRECSHCRRGSRHAGCPAAPASPESHSQPRRARLCQGGCLVPMHVDVERVPASHWTRCILQARACKSVPLHAPPEGGDKVVTSRAWDRQSVVARSTLRHAQVLLAGTSRPSYQLPKLPAGTI